MSIHRTWAVAGTIALAAALLPGRASAEECGCPAQRQMHAVSALPSYASAFAGRVTAVRDEGADRRVTFQVFRAWKGPRGKTLEVATTTGACGFAFEQGADYVVYATGKKEALKTDACTLTAPLGQSARAIRQLDLHSGYGSNPLRVPAAEPGRSAAKQ